MSATLRHAAGSLMVVGLEGAELTGLERAWLKLVRPAGVILFRRNLLDAAQTRALLDEAAEMCAPHAFRCVDVEGGTVDRLRDALAPMPSAQAVTAAMRQVSKPAFARRQGELIARGVRAFGFNTTLAPVLDLALPDSAVVMGTRSVAAEADGVVVYAREFLRGLAAHGVAGCGKHFPGLGGGKRDSHVETPAIARGWRELWREDLEPYRALRDELPMVMVNHAAYPATRGGKRPASASAYWIAAVLRRRIGYRGIIFSDDLEMGGMLKFLSIEEAVVEAIRAGMETVEICHSAELILRAYESLVSEAEGSAAFRTLLLKRARDVARKRARLFGGGLGRALTAKQFARLRTEILRFRDDVTKTGEGGRANAPAPRRETLVETA
ncbi:MAG TPA: beta-N-acetylhexosaminidase [Terracidiphilus sp.]|nr:beta-N-acetylhexosaminidase [Terracidiphilus sp.]